MCKHKDVPIISGWSSVCTICGRVDQDGLRYSLSESIAYLMKDICELRRNKSEMFKRTAAFCPHCTRLLVFEHTGVQVCQKCNGIIYIASDAKCMTYEDAIKEHGDDLPMVSAIAKPWDWISELEAAKAKAEKRKQSKRPTRSGGRKTISTVLSRGEKQ